MFTETLNRFDSTSKEGWYLVMLSSFACMVGALVVFIDRWQFFTFISTCSSSYHGPNNNLLDKGVFLSASMSLGAGVLVFSSLASLLPAAKLKLHQQPYLVFLYFLLGAFMTSLLTRMIHWCMPTAIHTCDVNDWKHDDYILPTTATTKQHHSQTRNGTGPRHTRQNDNCHADGLVETTLPNCYHHRHVDPQQQQPEELPDQQQHERYGDTMVDRLFVLPPPCPSTSTTCFHSPKLRKQQPQSSYGAVLITTTTDLTSSKQPESATIIPYSPSYVDEKVPQDCLTIGIQTAVAICFHKLPEGLIMFISNRASTEVGISIAAAICIHNLIEGAMIAIPFYYATRSRVLAFLYAALLGGSSQPLGALIGVMLLGGNQMDYDIERQDYYIGIVFAIVSGMMLLIAIHSMLPQAIKADQRYVSSFFFIGIFIVGLASLLKSV